MTLLIGAASALGRVRFAAAVQDSTFLTILSDLFAFETILFGLADIVALLGYWPQAYEDYELPRYLPLATALFVVVIFGVSHFPFVRRMMSDHRPVLRCADADLDPPAGRCRRMALRQSLYARINVFFLILINQFQVALGVRLNFFYRAFGNAIQVPDEAHMDAFWHQLLWVFVPAGDDLDPGVPGRVLRLLEFRPAMAALDDGVLHLALAPALDALPARRVQHGGQTDNPDQRISEDIGGFISGEGGRGTYSERGHLQLHHPGDVDRDQSGGVLDHPLGALAAPWTPRSSASRFHGFLFWVAVLYACFATGMMQLIGRSLSRLMFRQQAVEANFRFDLARIREFSEQIALLKGEEREIDRAGRVFSDVFRTVRRIIRVRTFLNRLPPVLYPDLGDHSLCGGGAVLFRGEEGRLRTVSTSRRTRSATSTAR